jgi:hypothetical protein
MMCTIPSALILYFRYVIVSPFLNIFPYLKGVLKVALVGRTNQVHVKDVPEFVEPCDTGVRRQWRRFGHVIDYAFWVSQGEAAVVAVVQSPNAYELHAVLERDCRRFLVKTGNSAVLKNTFFSGSRRTR